MKYPALAAIVALVMWPAIPSGAMGWQPWRAAAGVFDLGGPRSDGSLVVAGSGALYMLTPDGFLTPFARGYKGDPGGEAYLAVSPGIVVARGCVFAPDGTFALRLHKPVGVTRINADGAETTDFADVDLPSLDGIAFDSVGGFGHRLLVTGPLAGKTEVAAIDCNGHVQVVTKTAPVVEGGMAVAPIGFGSFGGDLIAPDELSGVIWAIRPDGDSRQVVSSGLPHGQDTGVESVAFVPAGFSRGGYVYFSDRKTANNPHPGSDHVLRLSSADLAGAGVREGDLLSATEGGATMIDVRCEISCHVITVVPLPTAAHGEGHVVFTAVSPPPPPVATTVQVAYPGARAANGIPAGAVVALLGVVLGGLAVTIVLLARRR